MPLSNYAELQTSVINFTHRADLAAILPDLVRLGEDVIFGDLEASSSDLVATLATVASVATVALPTDFIKLRSLSLLDETLQYITPEQFIVQTATGEPSAYTIIGQNLHLAMTPDTVYSLRLVYEARLVNLSATQTTNWLLTNFPAVYLYATLVQAGIYIKKDVTVWYESYRQTIDKINIKEWREAGALRVRHDIDLTSNPR